ncbi:MAG: hypothetical protein HFH63_09505 [Lachnospiraceae bacterium]|nr:hypothetical protein [Lachnospiraceae bacterium]
MEVVGEKTTQIAGVQVKDTFDVQRFFDTLAAILSHKYGVTITVKVSIREDEELEQEKQVV